MDKRLVEGEGEGEEEEEGNGHVERDSMKRGRK